MSDDLALARRAAGAAAEVLLSYYGRPPAGLSSKSSEADVVSDADREAERVIRELLETERPDDGMLGEEGSDAAGRGERRWIVDPLDGTVNFLYSFPAWSVSVALEDADGPRVGVVHVPLLRESFCAARGEGAFVEGADGQRRPLRVSRPDGLAGAIVATGFSYEPARRAAQARVLLGLLPRARDIRRAGAATLDLAWVAAGRVDAYFERGLHHWDWAAGRLLIEEAGGSVEWLDGEPRGIVAAGTPELVAELRAVVE